MFHYKIVAQISHIIILGGVFNYKDMDEKLNYLMILK